MLQPGYQTAFPSHFGENYWKSFRVFATRFDASGFTYWYLYIPGSYILFLLPFLLQQAGLITLFTPRELAFYSENPWLILFIGIEIILIVLSFNLWWTSICKTFQGLASKQRIFLRDTGGDFDREYHAFIEEYQAELRSTKRYLVVAISIATCLVLFWLLQQPYSHSTLLSPLLLCLLPGALLLGYFLGIATWIMIASGLRLRALTLTFKLNVEASHPDDCGGLRFLGNFCLSMAIPILVGVAFFALYGIGGTLAPTLVSNQRSFQIGAALGLIIFDVPLAFLSFFFPLWYIHREMVANKEDFQDTYSDYTSGLQKQLWAALAGKQLTEAKTLKEELEIAQSINPAIYPDWPFDRRILVIYLLPQALPVLSFLLQIFKG